MKKSALCFCVAVVLIMAGIVTGCEGPFLTSVSGPVITREFAFTDFTTVEAGNAFQVELIPSSTYSVSVTANESLFEYIEVTKSLATLKIGMRAVSLNWGSAVLRAKVTMPELMGLKLSGASKCTARGFKSSSPFAAEISGASTLDCDAEAASFKSDISGASKMTGMLKADSSDIKLSGASRLSLDGSGGNVKVEASGASSALLSDFAVRDANIELSGASRAELDISGRLDANISGASTLIYEGNPTLGNIEVTGASQFRRR